MEEKQNEHIPKPLKICTLDEVTDIYIGRPGTPKRAAFEQELNMETIARGNKIGEVTVWNGAGGAVRKGSVCATQFREFYFVKVPNFV